MSQFMTIVEAAKNGSMQAEVGSGISVMSDSLIARQPAIDEPSNMSPSAKASSSISVWSNVTCCHLPRGSVKRRSTYLTSLSLIAFRTSLAVFIICPSLMINFCFARLKVAGRPRQPETPLDRIGASLPGADANGFLDLRYKYLAIPDPARLRRIADRFDRRTEIFVRNDDFDLHLGQKVDDILSPPIKLGMPFLPAETLRFEDGDSLDSGLLQGLLHLVEFERLDDRLDLLHFGQTPHPRGVGRADPGPLLAARQSERGRRVNSIGPGIAPPGAC